MPVLSVVAGANGAGKSSLTRLGRDIFQDAPILDPDAIARRISYTEAKPAGYLVRLYFVGTSSVEINLLRVASRVEKGGHDVAEEDQRRRFPRGLDNFAKAWRLADEAIAYDNSGRSHRRVAVKYAGGVSLYPPIPPWAAFLQLN